MDENSALTSTLRQCSPVTRAPPGGESHCQRRRLVLVGRVCSLLAHQHQGLPAVFLDRRPPPSSKHTVSAPPVTAESTVISVGPFARAPLPVATNAPAAARPNLLIGHRVYGCSTHVASSWPVAGQRVRPICNRAGLVASSREGRRASNRGDARLAGHATARVDRHGQSPGRPARRLSKKLRIRGPVVSSEAHEPQTHRATIPRPHRRRLCSCR